MCKALIFLLLFSFQAHAACVEGAPMCFGEEGKQDRISKTDAISQSAFGAQFLKEHPKAEQHEIKYACRNGKLSGDICQKFHEAK